MRSMDTLNSTQPPYTDRPVRLRGFPVAEARIDRDGVTACQWTWWFAAPGHRDLWIAVGRTQVQNITAARQVLPAREAARTQRRCAVLGLPWDAVARHPQQIAELQLLAQQAMRTE